MANITRAFSCALIGAAALASCAPILGTDDGGRDARVSDTRVSDTPVATDVQLDDTQDVVDESADIDGDLTPDLLPDGDDANVDATTPMLHIGGQARVTATSLNLRSGPGTTNSILTSMPCGTTVDIVGGPTTGWWNIHYLTDTGWSSGAYLVDPTAFDPSVCMASMPDAGPMPDGGTMPTEIAAIFQRANYGVGYSYFWGHGSWRTDGLDHGSCSGSCPSCSHVGQYGADCSGFVAKVWQVPSPSALTTDAHPYSTYDFYNSTTHWSRVARTSMQAGDALVYNASGSGHIMLFESGTDPWGSIWTYEARGCSTGIVHNLRVASSTFVAIRREGL